tara:strand:+ start:3461 stop:3952 length:492 start_codon:yes stop_codon:yes gene_type:complete
MNKTLLISGFISLLGVSYVTEENNELCLPDEIEEIQVKTIDKEIHSNRLIEALIQVESNGKEDCIGDKHLIIPSVGVLQIRPIMVREVNRILKRLGEDKRYKNKDRYSRIKSIEMFIIWRDYHHKDDSDEVISRCWNGGPKGWKRKATLHYWEKVQKALKKIA